MCMCIYIYTHIHKEREREIGRRRRSEQAMFVFLKFARPLDLSKAEEKDNEHIFIFQVKDLWLVIVVFDLCYLTCSCCLRLHFLWLIVWLHCCCFLWLGGYSCSGYSLLVLRVLLASAVCSCRSRAASAAPRRRVPGPLRRHDGLSLLSLEILLLLLLRLRLLVVASLLLLLLCCIISTMYRLVPGQLRRRHHGASRLVCPCRHLLILYIHMCIYKKS